MIKASACIRYGLLFSLLILIISLGKAQQSPTAVKKEGLAALLSGDHLSAIDLLTKYHILEPSDYSILSSLAHAYLSRGQASIADSLFALADRADINLDQDVEVLWDRARTKHLLHHWIDAIHLYKRSIPLLKSKDRRRPLVPVLIDQCLNGYAYEQSKDSIPILSPVALVNSMHDEMYAIADELNGTLFFASNRKPRSNQSTIKDQLFNPYYQYDSRPAQSVSFESLSDRVQSWIPTSTDGDAHVLFYSLNGADPFIVTRPFHKNKSATDSLQLHGDSLYAMEPPIFPELGDRGVQLFGDSIFLFSSSRPGGLGGYDIYYTIRSQHGWSAPQNMGAPLNTPADEIDPCMTINGEHLYFSSNRAQGFGGFDIYKSSYDLVTGWSNGVNVGMPINSPADEGGLREAFGGRRIYLHSNRNGGLGGYDLYYMDVTIKSTPIAQEDSSVLTPPIAPHIIDEIIPPEYKEISYNGFDEQLSAKPMRRLSLSPTFYDKGGHIMSEQSKQDLDEWIHYYQSQTGLHFHLLVHDIEAIRYELTGVQLHRISTLEQVIHYLTTYGVRLEDIEVTYVGNLYPVLAPSDEVLFTGFNNQLARRIDVVLSADVPDDSDFMPSTLGIPVEEWHVNYREYQSLLADISYRIELVDPSMIDRISKKHYEGLIAEYSPASGSTHFYIAWTTTLDDIMKCYRQIDENLWPELYVIPFYQGHRIEAHDLPTYLKYFSDLKRYLTLDN